MISFRFILSLQALPASTAAAAGLFTASMATSNKSTTKPEKSKMEKTEWKKNGTSYLISSKMSVSINGYQMGRIMNGATSLPFNNDLFALGVAHTVAKTVKGDSGDLFERERDIPIMDASGDSHRREPRSSLIGPRVKLHPYQTRIIIFKQIKKVEEIQAQENVSTKKKLKLDEGVGAANLKDEAFYIHCLYDHDNICFVDPKGDCLYVSRNQIMVP